MSTVDRIRESAVRDAEQAEKNFHLAILGFAVVEAVCGGLYIGLAYFQFSLPVLIGVAAVAVYAMCIYGIYGLKLHIDESTQRVLKSVELLAEDAEATDKSL